MSSAGQAGHRVGSDRRCTKMVESCAPCIPIRNNRSQIVDVRHLSAFLWWRFQPRIVMFPIMQLLRTEEAVDLIRNRGVRVISNDHQREGEMGKCQKSTLHVQPHKEIELVDPPKIRSHFVVGRREQAARRPPRHIHDLEPSRHLSHLHRVHSAERMHWFAFLGGPCEYRIELVGE